MAWTIYYEEAQDRLWVSTDGHYSKFVHASWDLNMLVRHARRVDPGASFLLHDNAKKFRSRIVADLTPA